MIKSDQRGTGSRRARASIAQARGPHAPSDLAGLWHRRKVFGEDALEFSFEHEVTPRRVDILAPAALVHLAGSAKDRWIALWFAITDVHLLRLPRMLETFERSTGAQTTKLSIEFVGRGHTFGESLGPALDTNVKFHRIPLDVRLALSHGDDSVHSGPLFGEALARGIGHEEGKNCFIFDCHSHWRAWEDGIHTYCHAWECQECVTQGLDGVPTTGEVWGWRSCFCVD